jgi:phosphoribosylglycinamide formyltransferase-1
LKKPIYDRGSSPGPMNIVCFISGSGTNYREIVRRNPGHRYLVFTNRPGCPGEAIARRFGHRILSLSHEPFFAPAQKQTGRPPERNSPERLAFDQEAVRLITSGLGREPDLVCLAGYDLLMTDWLVDHYSLRMINVHPGDTTRGYTGLSWIPSAKAVLAGEASLRSTLFFVERIMDTGPILMQSAPLDIGAALERAEAAGESNLARDLSEVRARAQRDRVGSFADFRAGADPADLRKLERVCLALQDQLKQAGDWMIYPLGVEMIAAGRVEIDGRQLYLDGQPLPPCGFRPDQASI